MPRVLPAVMMAAAAAFPIHAADWGQLATISSTLGVNANRLCVGEGLRSDIGCPAYAPYVSATSGFVGIGLANPAYPLDVSGSLVLREPGGTGLRFWATDDGGYPALNLRRTDNPGTVFLNTPGAIQFSNGVITGGNIAIGNNNGLFGNGTGNLSLGSGTGSAYLRFMTGGGGGAERMRLTSAGDFGIGTTNPNAKLEVNGTISATNLRLSGNLYVSGSQTIDGVTFANGGVSATGIITATSFSGDGSRLTGLASGDRITSGTSHVIVSDSAAVTIRTNGADRLTINSSGNVGIGTVTPSAPLNIHNGVTNGVGAKMVLSRYYSGSSLNAASGISHYLQSGLTNDMMLFGVTGDGGSTGDPTTLANTKMVLSAAGRLGLGTLSPTTKLEVNGTISATNLRLSGNLYVSGSQTFDGVTFANGGVSATGIITATSFSGDGSRLTGLASGDRIVSDTTSIIANDGMDSISFTTAGTQRMVINSAGNVGIGTSAPSSRFHVDTGSSANNVSYFTGQDVRLNLLGTAVTNDAAIRFGYGATPVWQVGTLGSSVTGTGDLFFNEIGVGTPVTIKRTSGNVGIGTTSPGKTLDISGTAQVISRTLIGGTGTPSATLQVSGSLLLAGNDNIPCTESALGLVRRNPTTGRLQACR